MSVRKSKIISARLPIEAANTIREAARRDGLTVSLWLRRLAEQAALRGGPRTGVVHDGRATETRRAA